MQNPMDNITFQEDVGLVKKGIKGTATKNLKSAMIRGGVSCTPAFITGKFPPHKVATRRAKQV
jgi:hypothetical protein